MHKLTHHVVCQCLVVCLIAVLNCRLEKWAAMTTFTMHLSI